MSVVGSDMSAVLQRGVAAQACPDAERDLPDGRAVIDRLGTLLVERFHVEMPSADTDLLEAGILDSLELVELLLQLEQHFGLRLAVEDLELDAFRTLARIAGVVAANTEAAGSSAAQPFCRAAKPDAEGNPPLQARPRSAGMATIRIFTEDDVPAVAALLERVHPEHRWTSPSACESYFREMLLNNPWRDPELPSWVAEDDGGISGFLGVVPRRMLLHGRPIRVAVGCQFMVDPDRRHSVTALELVKTCISGPQDLTLADGANDQARRTWVGLGGTVSLLYSLHWTRPLRPARYMLSLLEERAACPRPLTFAARPLGALADALAARLRPNRFHREDIELAEDALDPDAMLAHLPDVMGGSALQPVYDVRSLAWLLEQTARKTRHGTLRARAVLDGERRLIGWYLYYLQAGGVSEVVQLAARNGSFDRVLQRLLADAWRHGAAAVRGRLDPRFIQELSDRHCWFRREGTWTLVHSRHADAMTAIRQGDAFLSRLEGEWWLRFVGG